MRNINQIISLSISLYWWPRENRGSVETNLYCDNGGTDAFIIINTSRILNLPEHRGIVVDVINLNMYLRLAAAELTKTHSLRLFFWRFCLLG